jgi:hypothetical protein
MCAESVRWKYKWVDQNAIEIIDTNTGDCFYINGCVEILKRYDGLPVGEANRFMEGYLAGIDWCDSQLKHCLHNFIRRD